jgi:predicted DsbA family dithiol-disulfide isomerase
MEKKTINLDIVSDVACPWCYVGKKHIEQALENLDDYEVKVNWKPFQLDPSIPEEGLDQQSYFVQKFGSMTNIEGMFARLEETGKNVGIDFQWMKRIPNTLKLHNLLHVASEEGFANELKEAFFKAYFEDVVDMTQDREIIRIMSTFGWEAQRTEEVMSDQKISKVVRQQIRDVQARGVNGVPFFIINNQYGISGAQPPSVLEQWIISAGEKIFESEAEVCDIDDPNC